MNEAINYGSHMHRAMRELIRNVLRDVESDGLPGEHHFFITFDTTHPDVGLSGWLRERYPQEMTVVLQHWFEGLEVTDAGFSVTLKFNGKPESLHLPFEAITTFADPSAEFGLRFETSVDKDAVEEAPMENDPDDPEPKDAEVVSLDSFRGQRK